MTPPCDFQSSIGPTLARYIALKRALGRRGDGAEHILRYLDRFLVSCHAEDLTRETFAAWARSMEHLGTTTRRGRLRTVYHFCLFRQRQDGRVFVPDPTQFPQLAPRPLPHTFSEAEIVRLLATASSLSPHNASPLYREVARLAIVVLYTTGLRRGEIVRLTMNDYDPAARVLHVRQTKFYKSRLVPLSADTSAEIDRYLLARQSLGAPCQGDAPLLAHCHGARFGGYTGAAFGLLLRKVIRKAGIQTVRGRAPRVHDFRFTFAVQALLRWYRTGVDVQARLPALATYMGHGSVISTQYYLTFLPATAQAASERFHAHCSAWLSDTARNGGGQ
jgi:integrase/recombinase XerD